jgi:hypothetical protein
MVRGTKVAPFLNFLMWEAVSTACVVFLSDNMS